MEGNGPGLPTVLVVEDEPLIRLEAVDMIEDAGFPTYSAGSADAAIALIESHQEIGILFTDVDMPGSMDGLTLAAYVHDRWPPIAILVASGVVDLEEARLPRGALFFPKPYPTSQIVESLQNISKQKF